MRDYFPDLDAASRVKSYEEARLLAIRIARAYGLEHVAMFTCAPGGLMRGFDNYNPTSWSRDRMRTLPERPEDPTLMHVRAGRSIALWDTSPVVIGGQMSRELMAILGNARDDGITAGVTVPFAKEGRISYINFTSTSATDVRDLRAIAGDVSLIANVVHGQLATLEGGASIETVELSQRQRDTLLFRREGMPVAAISDLFNVSESTVQEYINRAAQKLGVKRRLVVAEATRLRLI